jgi:type I restriction enzyme R subunit
MFRMVRENYDPGISVDREFSRKVAHLVQTHTASSEIGTPGKIYEIDDKILRYIEEQPVSDIEKVFNLHKGITKRVKDDSEDSPYLLSIGEKADAVIQMYKDRQKTTQDTLTELKKIVEEINAALEEQKRRNMPADEFSIFWILNKSGLGDAATKAHDMRSILKAFPHWRTSEQQVREVRQKFYSVFIQCGIKDVKAIRKQIDQILNVLRRASG